MKNQVVAAENRSIVERTPEVIAIEIRSIDSQAREFVLRSAIEIGKRLKEVKSLIPHGEWGKWLEANVSYSQSTANNFMRIADEYANSHALANLSYTQAVALLAIPAEEREAFVRENDVEGMSSRELKKAIEERQKIEAELKKSREAERAAIEAHEKAMIEKKELEDLAKEQGNTIRQLQEELKKAQETGNSKEAAKVKTELRKAEKNLSELQQRLANVEAEMDRKVKEREQALQAEMEEKLRQRERELDEKAKQREEHAAKQIAEMQEQLRKNNNVAGIKVKLRFEAVVSSFKELLAAVAEIESEFQQKEIKNRIAKLCDELKASAM